MNKICIIIFLYFPVILLSQNIDTSNLSLLERPAIGKKSKAQLLKIGNRLHFIYEQDTVIKYLAINRKILVRDSSFYYLSWNTQSEQIVVEGLLYKKEYVSPLVPFYDDFPDIPKSWDIGEAFWSLNGIGIGRGGGSPFCTGADGYIESIPIQDIGTWTGDVSLKKDFPKAGFYDIIKSLPIDKIFCDRYFLKQIDNRKKGLPYIEYQHIKGNLLKETYFDLLVTSDKTVVYALYHDKELSIWYFDDSKKEWQKQASVPFLTTAYFTCFEHKKELYLIDYESNIYKIHKDSLEKIKQLSEKLIDISLIINKDDDTVGYVKQTDIQNKELIRHIIKDKVIPIFIK